MLSKNKRETQLAFDRRWGINKNRKKALLNRSMFKTFSKLQTTQNNHITKQQIVKTLPNEDLRPISPDPKLLLKNTTQPIQNPQTSQNFEFISLDQAEAKIDILLKQKLKLLVCINKNKFFNKSKNLSSVDVDLAESIIKLNSEIQGIVENIKSNMNDQKISSNMQKWNQLSRKIKMIQKVMAENQSESTVIKKYYSKVSNNVTSYRSFSRPSHQEAINRIKQSLTNTTKDKKASVSLTPRFPFNSTNNLAYKLPNVDDYEKYRYRHQKPKKSDDSIITLSAYKTSYRPFIPQTPPSLERRYSSLSIRPPSRSGNSTYKDQYKHIKEKRVNFKELDCYKDKFRNLKINYNQKSETTSVQLMPQYVKLQKIPQRNKTFTIANTDPRTNTVPTPRSTSKVDYDTMSNQSRKMYAQKAKNSQLNFLRTSFRKLINND